MSFCIPAARCARHALGVACALLMLAAPVSAQVGTRPVIGLADRTPRQVALTHARLVLRPGRVIEDGTLLLRDGVIVAAGAEVAIPTGVATVDLHGKTIFAGFIEPQSAYGLTAAAESAAGHGTTVDASVHAGARHWNSRIRPETDLAESLRPDAGAAAKWRALGFTAVTVVPQRGILRGQGAVVSLADDQPAGTVLIAARVLQQAAFEIAPWNSGDYPGSLMGSIALLRQTLADAQWQPRRQAWQRSHPQAPRLEASPALDALAPALAGRQPMVFVTQDELDYDRALAIAREFGLKPVLLGNGHEYRRLALLRRSGAPVIVPLQLPAAPAVEDPDRALDVSLAALEHWQWAPYNARLLAEAGVPFAFTAAGLDKPESEFWPRVRGAVEKGLGEDAALSALTTQPAALLGLGGRLGTLEPGRLAHFIVADADLFRSPHAQIYEIWIDGRRHIEAALDTPEPRGVWGLSWTGANGPAALEIAGDDTLSAKAGATVIAVTQDEDRLLLYVPGVLLGVADPRVVVVAQLQTRGFEGRARLADGREIRVRATQTRAAPRAPAAAIAKPALPATPLHFPAGANGRMGLPAQPAVVLVRHATVWTQGPQGVLADADLLVRAGRVVAVGRGLAAPADAVVVDARGRHVTPGLIDAHSHLAIARGVNEGTHAATSEVRVGDVLDPTDIGIYRQLAGGVTAAQLLHGSANPIGGQSQIVKLRWGADAEGLKFEGAPATIKFALGENVKQANWGDRFTTRYPQTRMGVEQLDLDRLLAARAYRAARQRGSADDGGPLRRDLQLEALTEVLDGRRLVQVHSYRQDEILAFARLAQRFGFVPTFQHVLEGYKVADVLAGMGAGASTFSDWWAYKYEVIDAIPYNGALMTRQGVTVSFNSDDEEMGRRLNTEAAKAIKYGGLDATQALALVTANPARQLHLERRVGSLEPGKDADFVIWSADPLSTLAVAEQTWIDGRKYFDRDDDRREQVRIERERAGLIAAVLPERVKALKAAPGKDDGKTPAPASLVRPPQDAYAALRPIYHDSEQANSCHAGDFE